MSRRLGLLLALALATPTCDSQHGPSLVLITIDTLRADHLSGYGYRRDTSPVLDGLAARGALFETVVSALPETCPTCAALLTGNWPARLGLSGNGQPLDARFPTLATLLRARGYRTAAFVSGYPLTRKLCGLDRGFDLYDDRMPDPRGAVAQVQRGAEKTTDEVVRWLGENGNRPFFVWLHYYDPHGDYNPGPPYDAMFPSEQAGPWIPAELLPPYQRKGGAADAARYVSLYDGEIRRVDTQLRRLLEGLERWGGLERIFVGVTADHGESLTEHGYYFDHGNELYTPSLHVPLILAGPGVEARRIGGSARTVDVMPTLLELLGEPPATAIAGVSLVPWLHGERPSFLEGFSEARFKRYEGLTSTADVGPKLAARDDRFSVILRLTGAKLELYDHVADPGESADLMVALAESPDGERLRAALEQGLRSRRTAAASGACPEPLVFTPEIRGLLEHALWTRGHTTR